MKAIGSIWFINGLALRSPSAVTTRAGGRSTRASSATSSGAIPEPRNRAPRMQPSSPACSSSTSRSSSPLRAKFSTSSQSRQPAGSST